MSAIFYVYRNGKPSNGYKYEDLEEIWFTETNDKPPTPQISIRLKQSPQTTHNTWKHGPDDQRLTQESLESAVARYNKALIEIESRRNNSTAKVKINDKTQQTSNKKIKMI